MIFFHRLFSAAPPFRLWTDLLPPRDVCRVSYVGSITNNRRRKQKLLRCWRAHGSDQRRPRRLCWYSHEPGEAFWCPHRLPSPCCRTQVVVLPLTPCEALPYHILATSPPGCLLSFVPLRCEGVFARGTSRSSRPWPPRHR